MGGRSGCDRIESYQGHIVDAYGTLNGVPPADTAALFCLSFTNARVVSTIILFVAAAWLLHILKG